MTDRELLQQALDALDLAQSLCEKSKHHAYLLKAYEALRARLAQPEPEPVAWLDREIGSAYLASELDANDDCADLEPLYATPPKKEWVGLTDADWIIGKRSADYIAGAEWAEAKLKEKNS